MPKQVTLSLEESLVKLKKSLENVAPRIEEEVNSALKDAAYSAYSSIVAKAQSELHSTRQDYLSGLSFEDLGDNNFLISLDGDWASRLEDGFAGYNLTEVLLRSKKTVEVGSRTGQSWVQQSKPKSKNDTSHKFAHVPFERKPFSQAVQTADLASAIKSMTAKGINGVEQRITKIYQDSAGNPLEGKVAVAKSQNPLLDGLVKYQKTYKDSGKQTTQSLYINYRTVSEAGKPWTHPGFKGIRAFDEAEKKLVQQIELIINELI